MSVPEITCFHIAVVVADVEEAVASYKRFLGDGPWRVRDTSAWGGRVAYGIAGGQTWELIDVKGPGNSVFHQFRDQHGEGVQHIGFWTPDIRASVEDSLAKGARLVSVTTDAQGHTAVQLLPHADVKPEQLDALSRGLSWMDLGFGGWQLEYVSTTAGEEFIRGWLGEDYDKIILTRAP